ncbi:MAG: circadian clock protein KaiC [Planctomycetaceae bacterium]|nr:circadian clock protein KaiC [Planctomycetaceae bacterium]
MSRPTKKTQRSTLEPLEKCPTGIAGLDEVTLGGLPRGRPTLVCGAAGCGKTLLAMEFIVRGIREFGENGVFMSFEESEDDLVKNVASLGFDLKALQRHSKLVLDHVHIERREIEETGEYDLEGLFVRLGAAIDKVGAKRVAIDTLEALFAGLPNEAILRSELRRLFRWLRERGVTAIITGEKGEQTLTRYGLEEYISDCVIFLDHRIANQIATRRLRVVKYRGSAHGTNEYPTMIDTSGLSVLPISSLGLDYPVGTKRISTGVDWLDGMLSGKGYMEGSSILVSGTAGTGKTTLAAAFLDGVCRRGGRSLFFSFEESPAQIIRNMHSIGIDIQRHCDKGMLKIHSSRSSLYGLEQHLVMLHQLVKGFKPKAVVIDPVTNLAPVGSSDEIKAMLTRMIDYLKNEGVTTVFTSLTEGGEALDRTEIAISSLMDTWLMAEMVLRNERRQRRLSVLKSRGMSHSNEMQPFVLSERGIEISDV